MAQNGRMADARRQIEDVEALAARAQAKGVHTAYYEIPAVVGRIALESRWEMRDHAQHHEAYLDWIASQCAAASAQLQAVLDGRERPLQAPPMPEGKNLELRDGALRLDGEPVLLMGFMGGTAPQVRGRYFFQEEVMAFVSGIGGTRFDYTTSPVWPLYKADPSTHRVWAGGWCGHIICDRWSIGGVAEGECVICLENERMREAISQYIERETKKKRANPATKFYSLDWELAYICFCDGTLAMWRDWLRERHGKIETLNRIWGTAFGGFGEVTLPEMEVKEEMNRAKWYDFARFNCRRFTDYLKWSRAELRRHAPEALTCTGAPFYMMSAQMGWAGIDTELINEAMDVVLNEAHPSTLPTDVLMGMNPKRALLQDPEYHGDIAHVMAHFLHGDGFMQMWWWPKDASYIEQKRPESFYLSDVMRSPAIPLDDVALVMRNALDLRRLSSHIVQFHQRTAPMAILYSHDSMLQLPPSLRQSRQGPHLFAMQTVYNGTLYLDAFTRIATERQIDRGELEHVRVLILPAVEYQNAGTVARILNWVESGGTLVMTPNTWLGDEYARNADYLSRLGVTVAGMAMPGVRVTEARPDIEREGGFIMGAVSEVELEDVPKADLDVLPIGPFAGRRLSLQGWGVQQKLSSVAEGAEALARFADGAPALLRIPCGQGEVYYLATPLTEESFGDFMDPMFDAAGFPRPVRIVSPSGDRVFGVECRTVAADGGYLTYVINLNPEPMQVRLCLPGGISRVENLSYERDGDADLFLGRFETVLLRLHR